MRAARRDGNSAIKGWHRHRLGHRHRHTQTQTDRHKLVQIRSLIFGHLSHDIRDGFETSNGCTRHTNSHADDCLLMRRGPAASPRRGSKPVPARFFSVQHCVLKSTPFDARTTTAFCSVSGVCTRTGTVHLQRNRGSRQQPALAGVGQKENLTTQWVRQGGMEDWRPPARIGKGCQQKGPGEGGAADVDTICRGWYGGVCARVSVLGPAKRVN